MEQARDAAQGFWSLLLSNFSSLGKGFVLLRIDGRLTDELESGGAKMTAMGGVTRPGWGRARPILDKET